MDSTKNKKTTPTINVEHVGRGIALTIGSVVVFGFQDAIAKMLVQDYSVPQVVMMRYWAFGLFAMWLAIRQNGLRNAFHSNLPKTQILRALLLLADVVLFATAVRTVPLGELSAILLLFPVLVTVFSIPILGEKVGLVRWVSVAAGFVGALIILRPGFAVVDVGAVPALGAAVAFALYMVMTRKVARKDSTGTMMLYAGGTGLVLSSAVGIFYWQPLTLEAWGLVAILWVTTTGGHFLVMRAMAHAPASVLQPFNYLSLPWAITLSFIMFGHLIDFISLVGALIIAGAGLMVWARERRNAPKR